MQPTSNSVFNTGHDINIGTMNNYAFPVELPPTSRINSSSASVHYAPIPQSQQIPLNSLLSNPASLLLNNGTMTPARFDEYIKSNCDDILNFICDEMLENLSQMLSLKYCQLRTPLGAKPHHLEQSAIYQEYLQNRLEVISKRLQDYQITTISNRQAIGNLPMMPTTKNLNELTLQYRSHTPGVKRMKYIMELVQEIQTNCHKLWGEREIMHNDITQLFEENIRIICTHVTKTFQEMCPDLLDRLQTRKQIESQIQEAYCKIQPIHMEQRMEFYGAVYTHAQEQVRMIKDMLNITKILLTQYDPRNDPQTLPQVAANYTSAQERYRSLDKTINIWLKILESRAEMDNPIPILPRILHDLQRWLDQFQKFFLFCIQEWMPKTPKAARPVAPVQILQQYRGEYESEFIRRPLELPHASGQMDESVFQGIVFEDANEETDANNAVTIPEENKTNKKSKVKLRGKAEKNNNNNVTEAQLENLKEENAVLRRDIEDQFESIKSSAEMVNNTTPKLLQDAQNYIAKLKNVITSSNKVNSTNNVGGNFGAANSSYSGTTKLAGLVPLNPSLHAFYQNIHAHANKQLQEDQMFQQQIFAKHNQIEHAIHALSQQTENRLNERDLDQIFQDYSESTQHVQEVLQQDSQKSHFHAQQYELEKRLKWLNEQQNLARQQFEMMKPRIETQDSLVQSLNRVLIMLHQFSKEQGLQWLEFIKQERQLCLTWKTARSNYQDRILAFRSETRLVLADQLENTKQELAKCLHECFRNLAAGHQTHLQGLGEIVKQYQVTVGQRRETIELNHEKLLEFKLEGVSEEIMNVTDAMDFIMEQKETLDWHEYKVRMQEMLIMFVETMRSMLDALFQDKTILEYLTFLDEFCLVENNKGVLTVPTARSGDSIALANLPCCSQVWIQLSEFPEKVDAMTMMANSKMARDDAEEFVLEKHGYKPEHEPIAEEQENLGELIRNMNSYIYKPT